MSPTIANSNFQELPEEPDRFALMGANPIFRYSRKLSEPNCSYADLQKIFAGFLREIDQSFLQLSEIKDGALIVVHHHLWMPDWKQGRLTLFDEQHSLEGREDLAESAEDPSWRDALLWSKEQKDNKRKEIFDHLNSALHHIANEGLELFQLATSNKYCSHMPNQQTLAVPISENNSVSMLSPTDEQGRLILKGKVVETQNIETDFRITLYNDVFRRDISAISLDQLLENPDPPERDDDDQYS